MVPRIQNKKLNFLNKSSKSQEVLYKKIAASEQNNCYKKPILVLAHIYIEVRKQQCGRFFKKQVRVHIIKKITGSMITRKTGLYLQFYRQCINTNQRRKLPLSENKKLRIDPLWFGNFEDAEYPVQYSQITNTNTYVQHEI